MTKPTGNPRGRPRKDAVARNDGAYENVFLAVGTRQDRSAFTRAVTTRSLSEPELTSLYASDGFARRIVDMQAEEVTRAGFEIEELDEVVVNDVMAALESVNELFIGGCVWSGRQHGIREEEVEIGLCEGLVQRVPFLCRLGDEVGGQCERQGGQHYRGREEQCDPAGERTTGRNSMPGRRTTTAGLDVTVLRGARHDSRRRGSSV